MESQLDENIAIIIRQTDLSDEEAKKYLEKYDGDYMKVLEEYYGIKKTIQKSSTINQQIYKEIRTVMDDAAFRFYKDRNES